jgi:hypothetical protein
VALDVIPMDIIILLFKIHLLHMRDGFLFVEYEHCEEMSDVGCRHDGLKRNRLPLKTTEKNFKFHNNNSVSINNRVSKSKL